MEDPLQRIAALASTLSHAELRMLLILTAQRDGTTATGSTRELAQRAGLARGNAKAALHSLADGKPVDGARLVQNVSLVRREPTGRCLLASIG